MFNFSGLAKAASVAALTVGVAFAAQPAQKAFAQVSGTGSSAAADFFTGYGAYYVPTSSDDCASGAVPDGFDFCATDIPYTADEADGYIIQPVASTYVIYDPTNTAVVDFINSIPSP